MKRLFSFIVLAVLLLIVGFGCVTKDKAVGFSSTANGASVRLVGTASTGSLPAPEALIAGNQVSYASSPLIEKNKNLTSIPVFTMSWHRSFFGSLFGIDDTSFTMAYIGIPGELASDTMTRINAIINGVNTFKKKTKTPEKKRGAALDGEDASVIPSEPG